MNKNIIYRDLFIEKAIEIHNNKYDYSVIEYKNSRTKVKVKKNNIKLIRIKYNDNKDLKELISFKS